MCLDQGHNAVTPVGPEPTTHRYLDKYSTTEPLRSLYINSFGLEQLVYFIWRYKIWR